MDTSEAQARVDRIASFTQELAALHHDGVLSLTEDQRRAVAAYHHDLVSTLSSRFDVDRGFDERRMSIGMRVASLIGALALSAAVYLFFYRIWGQLSTTMQVAIVVAAPLLGIGATEV